jgi:hypothetical protein
MRDILYISRVKRAKSNTQALVPAPFVALPSPWLRYGLSASPYWQDALAADDPAHPLTLGAVTQYVLEAGPGSSRIAIAGAPGSGKTTLVRKVKAWAVGAGYFALDALVPIVSSDTPESLFGRVLSMVYDTLLVHRPAVASTPAMQQAQVLVRATREALRGGGISAVGFGASVSQSVVQSSPREILIDGPRAMRDLLALVGTSDGRGLVLHLNNLENVTDASAERAGTLLRDLRDPMLMHPGLHTLIDGTTDAIAAAITSHAQLRTVVRVVPVPPAPIADVHALLAARYAHLSARSSTAPLLPPVEDSTVEALSSLYSGDLRGMLQALDDGVRPLLSETIPARPLTFTELAPVLTDTYRDLFAATSDEAVMRRLAIWGQQAPLATQTQATLATLWQVRQPTVSATLAALRARGYVVPAPRTGREPMAYALSGTSLLLFDAGLGNSQTC